MKVPLDLPDDLLEWAEDLAQRQKKPVGLVLARLLQEYRSHFRGVREGERVLVLSGQTIEDLEVRLGGGSLLHQGDLLRKVDRLAGIQFQNHQLPFTPGMLEELTVRAERLSLTPEQLIDRTAQKLYEQFFTHLKDW